MLSHVSAVSASVTQRAHGTPSLAVPTAFPPFLLFSHINLRKLPCSHGLGDLALQQALAGVPVLTPDHTEPHLLPSGRRRLAVSPSFLPASCLDADPSWVHVDGYCTPRACRLLGQARDALTCTDFLLPRPRRAECPVGSSVSFTHRPCHACPQPPPTKMETSRPQPTSSKAVTFSCTFICGHDLTIRCF